MITIIFKVISILAILIGVGILLYTIFVLGMVAFWHLQSFYHHVFIKTEQEKLKEDDFGWLIRRMKFVGLEWKGSCHPIDLSEMGSYYVIVDSPSYVNNNFKNLFPDVKEFITVDEAVERHKQTKTMELHISPLEPNIEIHRPSQNTSGNFVVELPRVHNVRHELDREKKTLTLFLTYTFDEVGNSYDPVVSHFKRYTEY